MSADFSFLNTYFDKVYVLTLERAEERQKAFVKNFPGLNFSFFYGIDKNTLNMADLKRNNVYDEVAAKKHHRYSKPMSLGQIACALGHRLIYEDMIKNNFNRVLIFEDDAYPSGLDADLYSTILNEMPKDAGLCMFDYYKNEKKDALKQAWYHIQHSIGQLKWNHTMISNLYPVPYTQYWMKAGNHEFADAYAVTREAAMQLVKMQTPISFIADNVIPYAMTNNLIKGYISIPKLFQQNSTGTNKQIESFIDD